MVVVNWSLAHRSFTRTKPGSAKKRKREIEQGGFCRGYLRRSATDGLFSLWRKAAGIL